MGHARERLAVEPAKAQSAYASKLLFKQDASTLIAQNTLFLALDYSVIFQAALGNALSLGVWWIFDDETDTQS